jgi:hypothetical protein
MVSAPRSSSLWRQEFQNGAAVKCCSEPHEDQRINHGAAHLYINSTRHFYYWQKRLEQFTQRERPGPLLLTGNFTHYISCMRGL